MPQWMFGSLFAAMGLTFVALGIFGKDFRWGMSGDGEPAPQGLAKRFFIVLGLIFAICGVWVIVKCGVSSCPAGTNNSF